MQTQTSKTKKSKPLTTAQRSMRYRSKLLAAHDAIALILDAIDTAPHDRDFIYNRTLISVRDYCSNIPK